MSESIIDAEYREVHQEGRPAPHRIPWYKRYWWIWIVPILFLPILGWLLIPVVARWMPYQRRTKVVIAGVLIVLSIAGGIVRYQQVKENNSPSTANTLLRTTVDWWEEQGRQYAALRPSGWKTYYDHARQMTVTYPANGHWHVMVPSANTIALVNYFDGRADAPGELFVGWYNSSPSELPPRYQVMTGEIGAGYPAYSFMESDQKMVVFYEAAGRLWKVVIMTGDDRFTDGDLKLISQILDSVEHVNHAW